MSSEFPARFLQQIEFILEIDKIKQIGRQTLLLDKSRKENDAEHSWHLAVMAVLLGEYAAPGTDINKVVRMVLIHDLIEIDAGDTFCYDEQGNVDKLEREQRCAQRIFAMLPADQAAEFHALWEEFEARQTNEAKFAAALDRLQPNMHNYFTQGASWREHGVTSDRVIERNQQMAEGSPLLWDYAKSLIEDAVRKGYLKE